MNKIASIAVASGIKRAQLSADLDLLRAARCVGPADQYGGICCFVGWMDDNRAIALLLDKGIISSSRIGVPLGLILDYFVASWLPVG